MLSDKNWHVISVKENWEKKVAGHLFRKNIETYVPLNRTKTKNRNGTTAVVQTPLFPSLIFVHISEEEINIVKQTDGFLHFLYWKSNHAIVSRDDIKTILFFCGQYENMWVEKWPVLSGQHGDPNLVNGSKKIIYQSGDKSITSIFLTSIGYKLAIIDQDQKIGRLHHQVLPV